MKSGVRLGPGDLWKLPDQHLEASTCSVLLDARQGPRTKAEAGQEVCTFALNIMRGQVSIFVRKQELPESSTRPRQFGTLNPNPETLNPKL